MLLFSFFVYHNGMGTRMHGRLVNPSLAPATALEFTRSMLWNTHSPSETNAGSRHGPLYCSAKTLSSQSLSPHDCFDHHHQFPSADFFSLLRCRGGALPRHPDSAAATNPDASQFWPGSRTTTTTTTFRSTVSTRPKASSPRYNAWRSCHI
jgi:hypothetical protein